LEFLGLAVILPGSKTRRKTDPPASAVRQRLVYWDAKSEASARAWRTMGANRRNLKRIMMDMLDEEDLVA
jgi:hypothetical protein